MIRLIYTSRSNDRLPRDLKDIIATSRANNARREITGALCFLDGVYFQYLEGEAVVLEDLYRRILADPRNKDHRLIERRRIDKRLFTNWSMGLVTWNDETTAIFRAFNGEARLDLHDIASEKAAHAFEALSKSSNWLVAAA